MIEVQESEEVLSREAASILHLSKDGVDGGAGKYVFWNFYF